MIETLVLLGIGIILLIVEMLTGTMLILWPAVGFFVAGVTSYFTQNLFIVIVSGVIAALITLYFIMDRMKKDDKSKKDDEAVDSILGDEGIVVKGITKNSSEYGEVKVNGVIWNAKSKQTLKKGETVKVEKLSGSHIYVIKKGEK